MKYCHNKSDIPTTPHYAAIEFGTVWIPGDERSRTHPGHGYPEHSESKAEYIAFKDEEECKSWLKNKEGKSSNDFTVFFANPVVVAKEVKISLKF